MVTRVPRVPVTLTEESRDVMQRLATLEGTSVSKVIAGIIHDFLPVARQLVELGEASKDLSESQKSQLQALAAAMEAGVVPKSQDALQAFSDALSTAKTITGTKN